MSKKPLPHQMPEPFENITFKFIERLVTMSVEDFTVGGIATAETVVVGASEGMRYPDTDSLVLSALFQIQRIAVDMKHRVHVVAKASSSNTKKVAKVFFRQLTHSYVTFELIIPNQMTSAILTQIVEAGKLLQMSVLGYSQQGGMRPILAPPMESFISLCEGDKFVVVADLVN
eukprot:gene17040-23332_t